MNAKLLCLATRHQDGVRTWELTYMIGDREMTTVRFSYDSTWAWVSGPKGRCAIYPDDIACGNFVIGLYAGGGSYYRFEDGFKNQDAAIEQAEWRASEGWFVHLGRRMAA